MELKLGTWSSHALLVKRKNAGLVQKLEASKGVIYFHCHGYLSQGKGVKVDAGAGLIWPEPMQNILNCRFIMFCFSWCHFYRQFCSIHLVLQLM